MEIAFIIAAFLGTPELILLCVVILLLFGGKKIPELMRGFAKGAKEFKQSTGDTSAEPTEERTKS